MSNEANQQYEVGAPSGGGYIDVESVFVEAAEGERTNSMITVNLTQFFYQLWARKNSSFQTE